LGIGVFFVDKGFLFVHVWEILALGKSIALSFRGALAWRLMVAENTNTYRPPLSVSALNGY
jgi:hypothetical protein